MDTSSSGRGVRNAVRTPSPQQQQGLKGRVSSRTSPTAAGGGRSTPTATSSSAAKKGGALAPPAATGRRSPASSVSPTAAASYGAKNLQTSTHSQSLKPSSRTPPQIQKSGQHKLTPSRSPATVPSLVSPSSSSSSKKYLFGWNNALQGQMRPQSRRGHSCVRYDNFMIVYGGYRGRPLSDMWVLDTVSVRWSRFQTPTSAHGGKHPGQRTGHASVIIGDKMWLFGGETENHKCVNDLWVFDLGLKKWEEIITAGSLPSPRYGHTAVAFGTSILLFGGADRSSECFHDLWCFDTTNYSWTRISTEPKPSPRHGHTMTTVSSSKILVFGGYGPGGRLNDIWQLDPFTLQWSPFEVVGEVPARRAYHSAVAMRFKLLVFGGQGAASMGDLWQFSPGSATWTKLNSSRSTDKVSIMENVVGPAGRYGHSGEVFGSDKMFIFGGVGDASVYRDDLWFLYVDLSLPEPLEMEMHGASAGLDISLPPIDSFSLPSSIPHLDDSSHTLATTTHNNSGHDSVAVARRKRENDDDHQNATDSAEDFYASNGTTTNYDNGGESFSNIEPATELDDGGVSAAMDSMADLQGMRDELAMQLDKVSTDSRRFLLDETRRTRALATHTRRHLWDTFTAGLNIVGFQPTPDDADDDPLTDGDVTRLLKEARILVDDDKELNENDVILTSYYAASFEKKLKRFDLRLREVERRVVEQEREIERQRAVTDSRTEEVVAYFEAKLEHEVKAAEARTLDALAEHRRLIDEAAARQSEQFMRELAELRSSVHHVVADNVKKENEKEKEKEKVQHADDYDGKEEEREERVKRVEAEVVALAGELERMRARWDEAEAERDDEEEARLAEFEVNLQRTMEGANALGSLMAEYFHQNDDNAGDQDSADDAEGSGSQRADEEERGEASETNAEDEEDEDQGNVEGGEVMADAGDSVNVDEKEEDDENEDVNEDNDDDKGDGQNHGGEQDDDGGEEESATIEEEERETDNHSL